MGRSSNGDGGEKGVRGGEGGGETTLVSALCSAEYVRRARGGNERKMIRDCDVKGARKGKGCRLEVPLGANENT